MKSTLSFRSSFMYSFQQKYYVRSIILPVLKYRLIKAFKALDLKPSSAIHLLHDLGQIIYSLGSVSMGKIISTLKDYYEY